MNGVFAVRYIDSQTLAVPAEYVAAQYARVHALEVEVAELQSQLLHTQVTLDEVITERYPNQLSLR